MTLRPLAAASIATITFKSSWRMVRTSTASVFSTPASSMSCVAMVLLPTRSSRLQKICATPRNVVLGGSPRIYAGKGALQRSGKKPAPNQCALALGPRNPGAKAHFRINRLFRWTRSPAPPAEAGGSHQGLPATFSQLGLAAASQKLPRIHAQNLAGDTARARSAQKQDGGGNIGNFEQTAQQGFRFRGLADGRRHCFGEWCADPAGLDHVYQNSQAAGFAGDALGQPNQSGLAGGIGRGAKLAARSVDGPDQDHAPTLSLAHQGNRVPQQQKSAAQIDRLDHVPILDRKLPDDRLAGDSGSVNHQIEPPVLLEELLHGGADGIIAAHIAMQPGDVIVGRWRKVERSCYRTSFLQTANDGAADPSRTAGHNRVLACQFVDAAHADTSAGRASMRWRYAPHKAAPSAPALMESGL